MGKNRDNFSKNNLLFHRYLLSIFIATRNRFGRKGNKTPNLSRIRPGREAVVIKVYMILLVSTKGSGQ